MDVINEESDRLNHFVEEMMTLALLEGGQLRLRRSEMPQQLGAHKGLCQIEAAFGSTQHRRASHGEFHAIE